MQRMPQPFDLSGLPINPSSPARWQQDFSKHHTNHEKEASILYRKLQAEYPVTEHAAFVPNTL
jgi:hypothetical protein